ncbi:hypothetical protein EMN47_10570 [Prolixibacteraceae bacterium JC049]|nr:hypothetical protein [Prolixibacteraceae bacterium JC049]
MLRKIFLSMSVVALLATATQAQYYSNVARIAQTPIEGTARAAAMGNAFGALGGDFTSLSINPAGVAVYRSHEFTFTPTFSINDSKVKLGSSSFSDNEFKVGLGQIGYVGSIKTVDPSSSIVRVNFGVGYNKVADFNQVFLASNYQSGNSFLDGIVNYANSERLSNQHLRKDIGSIGFGDWQAKLAWETYLIDPVQQNGQNVDGQYKSILFENEKVDQNKSWERSGGITEYVFSAGLNFNHKLYLGATLGIQDILYKQNAVYSENFGNNSFSYTDNYKLSGTGYVFKVGAIYRPVSTVRLGLAFHTPTYFDLKEDSYLSMRSKLKTNYFAEGLNLFAFDYYTPMKSILSAAFVLNKRAIISVDGEYVDYTMGRYRKGSGGDNMSDINANIDKLFDKTFNFRIGGEYKLTKEFSVRAGYEFYGSPYKKNVTVKDEIFNDDLTAISAGLGYSAKSFFIDVAYKQYSSKSMLNDQQPNYSNLPLEQTNKKVMITTGFRF